jgi:signal transduction histidine kinase
MPALIQDGQHDLLMSILNTSSNQITVFEAVRDADRQIIDFRYILQNETNRRAFGRSDEQVIGKTLLNLFPHVQTMGFFERYRAVVETGEPVRYTEYIDADGVRGWYSVIAARHNDGMLLRLENVTARREAEDALQHQRDILQQVIDNTQAGLLLARPERNETGKIIDFRYVFTNKFNAQLTGYAVADMNGELISTLFPNWQADDLFAWYVAVVETGQSREHTFFYDRFEIRGWFDGIFTRVDGCILYSYNSVTKLKESELRIQQQRNLLQNIIDNGKAGMTLFDIVRNQAGQIIDFQYVFTNSVNAANTNLDVAQMTGHLLLDLLPNIASTDWYAKLVKTAETGEPASFLFPYQSEGISGWFDTLFVKLGNQVLFTDLNVTALKEAELRQEQQTDLLEQVMNAVPTAIVVHETIRNQQGQVADFRVIKLNQVAAEWLQNPIEKITNSRLLRHLPAISGNYLFTHYQNVIETGIPVRFDYTINNRYYDFAVLRFGDGLIVTATDVTTARLYQEQLEISNTELARSNENLRSFTYIASHDLQEPLRKVQSFGDILRDQFADQLGEQGSDLIRRMQASASRMSLLINDLLTYSRLGTNSVESRPFALDTVLDDLLENDLWAAIRERKATISYADLPTMTADRSQIRQLFQNLLSNAIKFQPEGNKPMVTVSSRSLSRAELPTGLTVGPSSQFYEISVSDNGIGFDKKYIDQIFNVFQRLHSKAKFGGSGIGLAICRKVVENHGGAITARSLPDQSGATFFVYLPQNYE